MTIDETDTALRIWGATLPASMRRGDWLCILVRTAGGKLRCEYRFRYHAGPEFRDDDTCSRHGFSLDSADPAAEAAITGAVRDLIEFGGFSNVVEREVNGDHRALLAAILELPGWSVKLSKEPGETL